MSQKLSVLHEDSGVCSFKKGLEMTGSGVHGPWQLARIIVTEYYEGNNNNILLQKKKKTTQHNISSSTRKTKKKR